MTTKGYTVLGWIVYRFTAPIVKRKIAQNRVKLGAAGVVLGVLVAGVVAARSGSGD